MAMKAKGIKDKGVKVLKKFGKKLGKSMGLDKGLLSFAKKSFKNMVPCLPAALLAWLEGGATFFSCMLNCMMMALGMKIAILIFKLVKDCLWKFIENAIKNICFPADAVVQTEKGPRTMAALKVGDRVQTMDGSYSDVYVFSHQDSRVLLPYVRLRTQQNSAIEMSATHFVPVSDRCDGVFENRRAKDVAPGVCIFTQQGGKGKQEPGLLRVSKVEQVVKQGMYNPFTLAGNLVVNGIVASSHSEWFLDGAADMLGVPNLLPSVYQAILAPARALYNWVGPEIARVQLEQYRQEMAHATENNLVIKPFVDLTLRALNVMLPSLA